MRTDVLGAPYQAETIPLADDAEGEVVATLVHRPAPMPSAKAVLHVHGFADYFFQTPAADFWVDHGYDFYAVDLRKYGRSLRAHQTPTYVDDLATYHEELDAALAMVTAEHEHVVISAHSTGGLTVPLWLEDRGHDVDGVFLNSPWLDMHGSVVMRNLAMPLLHQVGRRVPLWQVPRNVDGFYTRGLHRDHEGEYDFDLTLKPIHSFPVHAGWIRAIRLGQARIARGLDLRTPVLVISSTRSAHPRDVDDPRLRDSDVVLDVDQIRRRAALISRRTTMVQVEGAIHDVTLSPRPARDRVFAELGRWLEAYASD